MQLNVFSEIGRLECLMTHRPGREVDDMPPALMEQLLFDDILHGVTARREHGLFTSAIKAFGSCFPSGAKATVGRSSRVSEMDPSASSLSSPCPTQ